MGYLIGTAAALLQHGTGRIRAAAASLQATPI
jgi:hypothetical protein